MGEGGASDVWGQTQLHMWGPWAGMDQLGDAAHGGTPESSSSCRKAVGCTGDHDLLPDLSRLPTPHMLLAGLPANPALQLCASMHPYRGTDFDRLPATSSLTHLLQD